MVIDNNIPPVTVNDSVRIAKGIAAAGFPMAGVVTAAMFLVLPMPWPIVLGIIAIGGVFIAFVAALTKERNEFHAINRVRAQHEMSMKEVGYKASMRVWEAQQLALIAPPVQAQLPPAQPETWRIDGTEQPRNLSMTVLNRLGHDVRVDLVEGIITLAHCEDAEPIADLKAAMRSKFPTMHFRDESLTLARRWLVEQGITTDTGEWMVSDDDAYEMVKDARVSRPLLPPKV